MYVNNDAFSVVWYISCENYLLRVHVFMCLQWNINVQESVYILNVDQLVHIPVRTKMKYLHALLFVKVKHTYKHTYTCLSNA